MHHEKYLSDFLWCILIYNREDYRAESASGNFARINNSATS